MHQRRWSIVTQAQQTNGDTNEISKILQNPDIQKFLNSPQAQSFISKYAGFQGNLYPKAKNAYSHPPVYQKKLEVGKDEFKGIFSTIKIWVHEPTFEFPHFGIFLSLNNRHTAFFKFRDINEFDSLISTLSEFSSEIRALIPGLEEKEKQMLEAKRNFDSTLNQGGN